MKELKLFDKLWLIRISLMYIAIVMIITYITYAIHHFISSDSLLISVLRLTTSPFNAYFEKDYLSNIGLVFVILVSTEIYLKTTKRAYSYSKALVSGILASYTLSLSWFLESYPPSAGTSIVASTMLLITFFYICLEMIRIGIKICRHLTNRLIRNSVCNSIRNSIRNSIWNSIRNLMYLGAGLISVIIILSFYYGAYIQSNPSWYLHICGAILFSVFYILFTLIVSRK